MSGRKVHVSRVLPPQVRGLSAWSLSRPMLERTV